MNTTEEKGVSLVIFFVITFLAGSIPIFLFSQCRHKMSSSRGQAVLSLLNCFAGGVFLATCLLGLLVEGLEEYEGYREAAGVRVRYPFFHLAIGLGFFAVALVERLAVFLSAHNSRGDLEQVLVDHDGVQLQRLERQPSVTTMTADTKETAKTERTSSNSDSPPVSTRPPLGSSSTAGRESYPVYTVGSCKSASVSPGDWNTDSARQRRGSSAADNVGRATGHSSVMAVAILLALSFHTVFDGLAVGLQETEADIWTTTAAISIHKTIVAASLGLELAATSPADRPFRAYILLLLFALMAPLGVGIGIGVTSGGVDRLAHMLAGSLLQGVATGSFLYVTFFEVLGEEMSQGRSVVKVLATACGFGAMALAKIWDVD